MRPATCVLLAWLLAGCAGYRPYEGPGFEVVARGVAQRVEAIRDQPLRSLVSIQEVDHRELGRFVAERLDQSYPPGQLERETESLARLGLHDPGQDVRRGMANQLQAHLLGFYDPARSRLGLVSRALSTTRLEVGLARELVIAHELTHALQDQRVDIYELLRRAAESGSDRQLATQAVIEGEAQAVMYSYILWGSGKRIEDVQGSLGAAIQSGSDPLAGAGAHASESGGLSSRTFGFPYYAGASFIQEVYIDGGWPAVSRLFADRPVHSTEQILHPEKYTVALDLPQRISLLAPPALEAAGWSLFHEDTLGEFSTRSFIGRHLDARTAVIAATGWDGDLLQVHQGPRGELAFRWCTTWDSEEDAAEFHAALCQALPRRHDLSRPQTEELRNLRCETHGRDVFVVDGYPTDLMETIVAASRNLAWIRQPGDLGLGDHASSAASEARALAQIQSESESEGPVVRGDTLVDPRFRFRISRPSSRRWHFIETPARSARRVRLQRLDPHDPDRLLPQRFLNVDVLPLNLPLGLEQIAHQTERQLAFNIRGFKKLAVDQIEFDSRPAVQFLYRGTVGSKALRFHQVTLLHDDHQYILTAAAPEGLYEDDHEDLMTILASFRLE